MSQPPKLTEVQKNRLKKLEPQLRNAVYKKDLESAKRIVKDIQDILKPTGHLTRLCQVKNWLFELAMEIGEYDYAIHGFIGNRKILNNNTRVYLESTALLAICYLRKNEYENAKPFIKEVLQNEKIIKSKKTRRKFHIEIIERFDEEAVLFSLKNSLNEPLNYEEIQNEAGLLLTKSTEDEIYLNLGKALPQKTKDILFQIDEFSKNQLPTAERKLLPLPQDLINDEKAGKTVFNSLKRVIYNSICDPESEVYKAWCTNGMMLVLDKKYLTIAVGAALNGLGIGYKALMISAVALLFRFGLDWYCQHNKPISVMEIRTK